MTLDDHIGRRVRTRRIMLNKTIDEIAVALGYDTDTIERFECGETRIGTTSLYELAQILSVSITYFFFDGDDGAPWANEP